jgi:Arc-like DNA binding domain
MCPLSEGKTAMKRKKSDTVQLSKIRMREELRQKLARDAERSEKTLNSEIVDRLEKSYELDERHALMKEYLHELVEKNRKQFNGELEALRKDLDTAREESAEELKGSERKLAEVAKSTALLDTLLGENRASRELLREISLLLANAPEWNATQARVDQTAKEIAAAVKDCAGKSQ